MHPFLLRRLVRLPGSALVRGERSGGRATGRGKRSGGRGVKTPQPLARVLQGFVKILLWLISGPFLRDLGLFSG